MEILKCNKSFINFDDSNDLELYIHLKLILGFLHSSISTLESLSLINLLFFVIERRERLTHKNKSVPSNNVFIKH